MNRFFRRIREKANDIHQPPVLIAALGDSVTQGAMEYGNLDSDGVYHRHFQRALEEVYCTTTFSLINAGIGGTSAEQGAARVSKDVCRFQPDLVLIAFGLNDAMAGVEKRPDFENSLKSIIATVRAETEADIALLTPPFVATKRTTKIHPEHDGYAETIIGRYHDGSLAQYAEGVRTVAKETNVLLVDVYAEWVRMKETGVDTDMWLCNGLNHPDFRGHRLAGTVLFNSVFALRH